MNSSNGVTIPDNNIVIMEAEEFHASKEAIIQFAYNILSKQMSVLGIHCLDYPSIQDVTNAYDEFFIKM